MEKGNSIPKIIFSYVIGSLICIPLSFVLAIVYNNGKLPMLKDLWRIKFKTGEENEQEN